MKLMTQVYDNKFQVLLFLGIYNYVFNNGDIIVSNIKFKEAMLNKLQTNGKKENAIEYIPYWANIFNFDKNIIDIMIENLLCAIIQ